LQTRQVKGPRPDMKRAAQAINRLATILAEARLCRQSTQTITNLNMDRLAERFADWVIPRAGQ